MADVHSVRRGSGIIWVVVGEEICSAGSSVAAAGWEGGESFPSAERVWPDDGGEDLFCGL